MRKMAATRSDKRNFWALVAEKAGFGFALSFAGPYTVLTALAAQLTTSAIVIGSITTVWNGALFLPVSFVARWIRNHSERMPIIRRLFLGRALAFPVVALWLFFTRAADPVLTLAVLIAGMLVFCLSDGANSIPYIDMVARIMDSKTRAKMTWQGLLLGGVLGIAGSFVVQRVLTPGVMPFPVNFAFLLGLAGLIFFGAWLCICLVPERDVQAARHRAQVEGDAADRRGFVEILRHDRVFRRMLLTRLFTGADQMAVPFYTVFGLTVLKLSPEMVGLFVGAQTIGALLAPIIYGWIAVNSGAHRVIQVGALVQLSSPLIGVAVVVLGAVVPALSPAIALAFVATGFSNSGMALGYYNYPLDWCPDCDRPNYMALLSVVSATSMLAPLLGGLVAQSFSYLALYGFTALLVLIGAVIGVGLPDMRMRHT